MARILRVGDIVQVMSARPWQAGPGDRNRRRRVRVDKVRIQKVHLKPGRKAARGGGILEREVISTLERDARRPRNRRTEPDRNQRDEGSRVRVFAKSGARVPEPARSRVTMAKKASARRSSWSRRRNGTLLHHDEEQAEHAWQDRVEEIRSSRPTARRIQRDQAQVAAALEAVEGVRQRDGTPLGRECMAWVITRLCRDCVDQSCVEVCPVDCIYVHNGTDTEAFPNQLYIDPEECINCGVCEPECPWEAIFEDEQVPEIFREDIALNAKCVDAKDEFSVPEVEEKDKPSPEQIDANKRKWDYAG